MDRELCHCMLVMESEVRRVIRAGARTVEEVSQRCEAGTGCGSCRGGIAMLLEQEAERKRRGGVAIVLPQLGLFGDEE